MKWRQGNRSPVCGIRLKKVYAEGYASSSNSNSIVWGKIQKLLASNSFSETILHISEDSGLSFKTEPFPKKMGISPVLW